jgi:hypothetical protein
MKSPQPAQPTPPSGPAQLAQPAEPGQAGQAVRPTSSEPLPSTPGNGSAASPGSAVAAPDSAKSSITSITKVVGEVGERFVTSREVRIQAVVLRALDLAWEDLKSKERDANKASAPVSSPARQKALEGIKVPPSSDRDTALVRETEATLYIWAVYLEAKSFRAALSVSNDNLRELEQMTDALIAKSGAAEGWRELQVTRAELSQTVQRLLLADDYERLKSDAVSTPVSDVEAEAYFNKNRSRFGTLPFDNFRSSIKEHLSRQRADQRLRDWREVLRRKYKVKNYIR